MEFCRSNKYLFIGKRNIQYFLTIWRFWKIFLYRIINMAYGRISHTIFYWSHLYDNKK